MKVITIKQPFATLIAEGIKEYEFRTWNTKYRGEIYIHAGKSTDKRAMKKYEHLHLNYPSGFIIAKAILKDSIPIEEKMRNILKEKNAVVYSHVIKDKEWLGYGFQLEDVQKIEPIEMNGQLGLWNYEEKNH